MNRPKMTPDYVKKNWWLVRHAPVLSDKIYGHSDFPADFSDAQRLEELAARLPTDGVVISSDLVRCTETARQILTLRENGGQAIVRLASLREQSFGTWEGRTHSNVENAAPELYRSFWQDPVANRPAGGESFSELVSRVQNQITDLLQTREEKNIVMVAHAGTIRAVVGLALSLPPEKMLSLSISPLSLTLLTSFSEGSETSWQVSCVNDCGTVRSRSQD